MSLLVFVHTYSGAAIEDLALCELSGVHAMRGSLEHELVKHLEGITSSLQTIVKHAEAVRDLKTNLNALSPVARLPPELLIEIFVQYKLLRGASSKSAVAWQTIAHVCRHWRAVALECSSLWGSLDMFAEPECINTFLDRSRQTPLSVHGLQLPVRDQHLPLLGSLMQRVEYLPLFIHDRASRAPALTRFAPFLRGLSLETDSVHSGVRLDQDFTVVSDLLFGDAAPHLERLNIRAQFEWHHTFHHPNMRDLRIFRPRYHDEPSSITLDVLEAMPQLEVLILKHCVPEDMPPSRPGDRMISLPRLRSITVSGETVASANFVTHLDIPSDASVRVYGKLARPQNQQVPMAPLDPLASCLNKFKKAHGPQHLTMINNATAFRFSPAAEASDITDDFTVLDDARTGPELIIIVSDKSRSLRSGLVPLCESLPVLDVVKLSLAGGFSCKDEEKSALADALKRMPAIRSLYLDNGEHDFKDNLLVEHAFDVLRVDKGLTGQSPLLPELQVLMVHRVDFASSEKREKLVTCLKARQECGFRVRNVELLPFDERVHAFTNAIGHDELMQEAQ